MITEALKQLIENRDLNAEEMKAVMYEITEGKTTDAQIAAFLTALKMKGESVEEITAAAEVMREKCIKTDLRMNDFLDIVGTGGDMSNTFNISTASAFVAAAGGVPVAKHGNRALTSRSGSADVLEACGINVNLSPEKEKELFNQLDICFLYAPNHHPAMKYAAPARHEMKFRTLFNILGPLTNPANANRIVFGVYDKKLVCKLARVIYNLGTEHALVLHGNDGLDEATLSDETVISEVRNGKYSDYSINTEETGLKKYDKSEFQGGSPEQNAQIMKDIYTGKEKGAKRDIVILNSGLALYIHGKTTCIKDGVSLAGNIIDSGLALDKFEKYIKLSNEV